MGGKERNNILLSFSCLILLIELSCSLTDQLLQGQVLQDGKELVSAYGKFRLGFFSHGQISDVQYLGTWYHRESYTNGEYKPVWVANRETPVLRNESAVLTIDSTDGNLKILRKRGNPVAVSSVQGASNTSATLLESGNLVLNEMNPNGSTKRMLWQSFDYPTDTLLPGMKLGINLRTGHKWFLQSWTSDYSPAQGSFIFGMDPNLTNRLTVWWQGEVYWTTGFWLNRGGFDYSPSKINMISDYHFNYTWSKQEIYFNYSVNDDGISSFPLVRIGSDGSITIDRGPNSPIPIRYEKPPLCGQVFPDFKTEVGFMYGEGLKFKISDTITSFDCRLKCSNNCSCIAFAIDENKYCWIWGRGAKFIKPVDNNYGRAFAIYVKVAPKENKWWKLLITFVGVASVISLLCYLCYLTWGKLKAKVQSIMNRKKLLRELDHNVPLPTSQDIGAIQGTNHTKFELKIFDFQDIVAATDNFSVRNKLGQGGFGSVYKGKLLDGHEIAIKRLSRGSGQGIEEFKNEAKLVAKLQHTNLVRLLGCSLQGDERLLIYEYMPNKSLDIILFDSVRKNLLNWKKRFSIIEGIAQGILYLHMYSRLRVIHRDLKASNVLLDDQMNPKISDFGMAIIFGANESEANTNRIVGTHGYMSPEYLLSGIVSTKTDVFSFGVLVLEIVSGKKNRDCCHRKRPLNLIGYAWLLLTEGRALELIDSSLEEPCSAKEVIRCIHVGLLCVQDQAMDRPTMPDVVFMLKNETMSLPSPKQPAFFINFKADQVQEDISESNVESCSINDITISAMKAR